MYTVHPHDIVAHNSPIEMTLVRSDDNVPFEYAYTQEALDEALAYYADRIPDWLDQTTQVTHRSRLRRFWMLGTSLNQEVP